MTSKDFEKANAEDMEGILTMVLKCLRHPADLGRFRPASALAPSVGGKR